MHKIEHVTGLIFKSVIYAWEVSFGIDKENHKIFKNGPASVKPRNFMANLILSELLEEGINISEENVKDAFLKVDELSKLNISNFLNQQRNITEIGELQLALQDSINIVRMN